MSDQQDVAAVYAAQDGQPRDLAADVRLAGTMIAEALEQTIGDVLVMDTDLISRQDAAAMDGFAAVSPVLDELAGTTGGQVAFGPDFSVLRIDLGHCVAQVRITVETAQQ